MIWVSYTINFLALISMGFSLYYSFKSRRTADTHLRGLLSAKMNISMGIMLTLLSTILLFVFIGQNEGSTIRVIIGALFLLIGLFNIFAGLRNRKMYTRRSR